MLYLPAGKTTTQAASAFMQAIACVAQLEVQLLGSTCTGQEPTSQRRVVICIAAHTHTAVDTLLGSISLQWPDFMDALAALTDSARDEDLVHQRLAKSVRSWLEECRAADFLSLVKAVTSSSKVDRPSIMPSTKLPCQEMVADGEGLRKLLVPADTSKPCRLVPR